MKFRTSIVSGSAILFSAVYSRGIPKDVHKKTCARIFIVALFLTEKIGKYPNTVYK